MVVGGGGGVDEEENVLADAAVGAASDCDNNDYNAVKRKEK